MKWNNKDKVIVLFVGLFVALTDQFIKLLMISRFVEGESRSVIPGIFNLVLAYNRGVAFGIFSTIADDTIRHLVLGVTTLIALTAVYLFAKSETCRPTIAKVALGLVIGGAVGNFVDRIRLGYVIDYLDFYTGTSHWPAFNIADSSICIAVAILLLIPSKSPSAALQ